MEIELIKGDITELDIDVIVNAAKTSLRGGSGLDGAIHSKAGKELLEECISIGGCMTGDAKLTPGYQLKAKHIIHTVGPVWQGGQCDETKYLASCYEKSLRLAESEKTKIIAFPCISTGGYGFPSKEAAKIAIQTIRKYPYHSIEKIIFCCYQEKDYAIYQKLLSTNPLMKLYWIL